MLCGRLSDNEWREILICAFFSDFKDPEAYKLVLQLPYPVCEDQGSAKFDKSQHNLVVTLPVKAKEPVSRLISTDSGINMEFDEDTDHQSWVRMDKFKTYFMVFDIFDI